MISFNTRIGALPTDIPFRAGIMGILNITPDSFSDGGRFAECDAAVSAARKMFAEGAMILDIGGQSTRPGYSAVTHEDEWRRIQPIISRLHELRQSGQFDGTFDTADGNVSPAAGMRPFLSVDTFYPEVAQKALEAGADIINDVTGFSDPRMIELAAATDAGCIIMHNDDITDRPDPVAAVREFFEQRVEQCVRGGISPRCICLDCGIGFGKTRAQEVELLERMGECRVGGLPILAAASRKRVIEYLSGGELPTDRRDPLTHAAHLTAVHSGADMVRVHDVLGAARSLRRI